VSPSLAKRRQSSSGLKNSPRSSGSGLSQSVPFVSAPKDWSVPPKVPWVSKETCFSLGALGVVGRYGCHWYTGHLMLF